MNFNRYLNKYIADCAGRGICSLDDISTELRREISTVDKELEAVEPLRIKRLSMQKALDHVNGILQTDKVSSDFNDASDELKEIRIKVYGVIAEKAPISNRDLIMAIGYGQDSKVIRATKWFGDHGIIERDSEMRLVRGTKWSEYDEEAS